MSSVQASVAHLETVVDLGGRCSWCDEPLEPGEVVVRRPAAEQRVHEEGCLADQEREKILCRRHHGVSSGSATSTCARCSRRGILLLRCGYSG